MSTNKRKPELAHIGKAIADYLTAHGMNQGELGRMMGVSSANPGVSVSGWIAGKNKPSGERRVKLANLLGVDLSFFEPRKRGAAASKEVQPPVFLKRKKDVGPARQALMLVPQNNLVPGTSQQLGRMFEEHDDGTTTVKLHARLPTEKALQVFKLLMEVA
jgi:transcriptional regulator with XRE-family HTH domain